MNRLMADARYHGTEGMVWSICHAPTTAVTDKVNHTQTPVTTDSEFTVSSTPDCQGNARLLHQANELHSYQ
jgi:hypothetical protein